ncbi:HNH endonuclease signature motif containing protein [Roseivivax halodurans]|uniref:HNH endonuclease n=1 Tax=Roseivivax halodurans TaxID=93683 RepID=UPI00138ABA31
MSVRSLKEANSICEACGEAAPFLKADGEPFLDMHHVLPLAAEGPDTIDNAAACYPNCHRLVHHGAEAASARLRLVDNVTRLKDFRAARAEQVMAVQDGGKVGGEGRCQAHNALE